jgi:hypothetical protein
MLVVECRWIRQVDDAGKCSLRGGKHARVDLEFQPTPENGVRWSRTITIQAESREFNLLH